MSIWFASYKLNNNWFLAGPFFWAYAFLEFIHRCCGREGMTSGLHSKRFSWFRSAIKISSMIFYSMISCSSNFDAWEILVSNNVQLFEMEEFRILLLLDSCYMYISLWLRNLRDILINDIAKPLKEQVFRETCNWNSWKKYPTACSWS